MTILKFIMFSRNTTSVRPTIVRAVTLALMALFSMAILEVLVLVLGTYGLHPTADMAEWMLRAKAAAGKYLHGI